MAWIVSNTVSTTRGESPSDGSSMSSSAGEAISARPIAAIWRSPPERVPANCPARSASRGKSSRMASNRRAVEPFRRTAKAPSLRFSSTVISGQIRLPSGTCAMPASTTRADPMPTMERPSKRISPASGLERSLIARSVVVLPAPFAPKRATTSRRPTSRVTPRSAGMPPRRTCRSRISRRLIDILL